MSAGSGRLYRREESEFDRAVAFIDATYALALTLLVTTLDIGGERLAWQNLSTLDDALGSQFIAFLISFVVIAGFWLRNHRMVASWTAIDTPLIVLNLAIVAVVILLPFTTEAMGDERVSDLPLPTAVYALDIALACLLSTAAYLLARRRGLARSEDDPAEPLHVVLAGLTSGAVFLISIAIAYLASPDAARWSWLALVPLAFVDGALARRLASRR
jgi:uncharacterized membrane protein